ncbi:MAG: Type secretory pathway VirB4 component-like protein [Clostridiales bacterium]|jgi:hypothetical protein|nr:Type secretory pathway VirB4 component-like protein [Clostridiales bacterium]
MAVIDLISPPALGFKPRYIVFGDMLARVLVFVNYPPKVKDAWLSKIANMPGVIVSMHLTPADPGDMLQALNKSIQEFSSRLAAGGQALSESRWKQSIEDARELMRKIDQESQNVYTMTVTVMITAHTEDELNKKTRQVETACAGSGIRARTSVYLQEQGLKSAGPFGLVDKRIVEAGGKEVPAETVAAAYPWVSSGLNHGKGTVIGRDTEGGLILVDRWNPPEGAGITNPNMNILATSGAGKSFAVKTLLLREFALGARVLIIDPEREYMGLCKMLGGSWINAAGGSGKINPLEVRPVPDTEPEEETDDEMAVRGPLAVHFQKVKTFFQLYLPSLTDVERAVLNDAVLEAYRENGIDWSTKLENVDKWPTVGRVYELVRDRVEEKLAVLLKEAVEGADCALWNGQTTIPPAGEFTVFDIRDLTDASDQVRRAQYFNILSYAWDLVREGRATGKRTVLVVDEAWLLADPETPQAIGFLRDLSKRIRKYGGSLTIVTQNVVDFLAPELSRLGQPVITNANMKLLMRQESKDLEALTELLNLSEAEQDLLANAKRGEGLLLAGNQRVHARIEAAPHEFELIEG